MKFTTHSFVLETMLKATMLPVETDVHIQVRGDDLVVTACDLHRIHRAVAPGLLKDRVASVNRGGVTISRNTALAIVSLCGNVEASRISLDHVDFAIKQGHFGSVTVSDTAAEWSDTARLPLMPSLHPFPSNADMLIQRASESEKSTTSSVRVSPQYLIEALRAASFGGVEEDRTGVRIRFGSSELEPVVVERSVEIRNVRFDFIGVIMPRRT